MADLSRTIEIIFGAVDQTSSVISGVKDELGGLSGTVSDVAAPLADLANAVLLAETAFVTLGAAVGGAALNAYDEFGDSIKEVGTLFGATGEQVRFLEDGVLSLARESNSGIDSITGALYNAVSATGDWQGSIDFLREANSLATAGVSDLNTSVGALTTVLGAYGAGTDEAGKYADAFFVTIQNGKTTLPELSASIGQVAATAAAAGVDFDTIGAAMAALTLNIGSTNQSATVFKALLSALSKPSTDLAAAMGGLSLETDGFVPVIKALAESTGGSQEKMAALFGSVEAANGALILANDTSGKFASTLEAMADKTGKAAEAAGELDESALNISNAWQELLIVLGRDLLDSFEGVDAGIVSIFQAVADAIKGGSFDELTSYFNSFADGFGETLGEIAKALPQAIDGLDFSGLLDAFDELLEKGRGLFEGLFDGLDLTQPEDLQKALQIIVDSFTTLTNMTSGIAEAFRPVIDALGETIKQFNSLGSENQIDFGETIGSAKVLIDVGVELGAALIAIGKSGVEMGRALDVVFGGAKVAVNALQVAFDTAVLGIAKLAQTALAATGFQDKADEIQTFIDAVYENALRNSNELADGWRQATGDSSDATDALRARLDAAEQSLGKVRSTAGEAAGQIQSAGDASGEAAGNVEWLTDAEKASLDAMLGLTGGTKDLADGLDQTASAASAAGEGSRAVGDAAEQAENKQRGFIATVEDGVPVFTQFGTALSGAKEKTRDTTATMDEAAKKSEEYALKVRELDVELEKIASEERVAVLQMSADIQVAKIEADAERAVAAFESVGQAVESSNKLVGDLAGSFLEADSFREQFKLEDLMDDANKRASEALETQKKLTEAEIERINAQTDALQKGDALITIDGSGLEPQLEAFMWEILKAIRVRANADFQDYLLGLAS